MAKIVLNTIRQITITPMQPAADVKDLIDAGKWDSTFGDVDAPVSGEVRAFWHAAEAQSRRHKTKQHASGNVLIDIRHEGSLNARRFPIPHGVLIVSVRLSYFIFGVGVKF